MNTITCSHAQKNMKSIMERVCDNSEPTLISSAKRKVVIISLDDYNAFAETHHLLSNPANAKHLRESLSQANNGF